MSRQLRLILVVSGLIVLSVALVALVYTLWPLEGLREQVPLAPTLFAGP